MREYVELLVAVLPVAIVISAGVWVLVKYPRSTRKSRRAVQVGGFRAPMPVRGELKPGEWPEPRERDAKLDWDWPPRNYKRP